VAEREIGYLGELHPHIAARFDIDDPLRAYIAEIDLDSLIELAAAPPAYRPVSRFPAVKRDIALVFPASVTAEQVESLVRVSGGPTLRHVRIVDVYVDPSLGEDRRSLALALEFQSEKETLTQETVSEAQDLVVERLSRELGGVLRS